MSERAKTILLVEDEPLMRELLQDVLIEEGGFNVLVACDGTEALAEADRHSNVDLVLADHKMPGSMNGPELLHHFHQRSPSIALILMSGGLPDVELPEDARFIQKPVSMSGLVAMIHELLNAAQA